MREECSLKVLLPLFALHNGEAFFNLEYYNNNSLLSEVTSILVCLAYIDNQNQLLPYHRCHCPDSHVLHEIAALSSNSQQKSTFGPPVPGLAAMTLIQRYLCVAYMSIVVAKWRILISAVMDLALSSLAGPSTSIGKCVEAGLGPVDGFLSIQVTWSVGGLT